MKKIKGLTFVVDIDDTLILYPDSNLPYWERGGAERYINAIPNVEEIKKINKLYKENTIIIHTGRGWGQLELTKKQLKRYGIKYHSLILGKPFGIPVDKDALKELP